MSTMDTALIEYVKPSIQCHTFVAKLCDSCIKFQALKLENSVYVWIGSSLDPVLENMCVAMCTPYSDSPLVTKIMGEMMDMSSSNLALRLSKRLGKPVYVSCNVESDRILLPAVEKRLLQELKEFPQYF